MSNPDLPASWAKIDDKSDIKTPKVKKLFRFIRDCLPTFTEIGSDGFFESNHLLANSGFTASNAESPWTVSSPKRPHETHESE